MPPDKVISIINQKGGVGKTTTAINLSASISLTGRKTLLIDMDPQGNATSGFDLKGKGSMNGIYRVLTGDGEPERNIVKTEIGNLDMVPWGSAMIGVEPEIMSLPHKEKRLSLFIEMVRGRYDYIFIDSPPSLGILTINSLVAADTLLIPLQCEYYAIEGISDLLKVIGFLRKGVKPSLRIEGILMTMFDCRNSLNRRVIEDAVKHFGPKVFKTIIHRNIRISESQSHGKPAILYDSRCRGSLDYLKLTEEIIFLNEGRRIKWVFRRGHGVESGNSME